MNSLEDPITESVPASISLLDSDIHKSPSGKSHEELQQGLAKYSNNCRRFLKKVDLNDLLSINIDDCDDVIRLIIHGMCVASVWGSELKVEEKISIPFIKQTLRDPDFMERLQNFPIRVQKQELSLQIWEILTPLRCHQEWRDSKGSSQVEVPLIRPVLNWLKNAYNLHLCFAQLQAYFAGSHNRSSAVSHLSHSALHESGEGVKSIAHVSGNNSVNVSGELLQAKNSSTNNSGRENLHNSTRLSANNSSRRAPEAAGNNPVSGVNELVLSANNSGRSGKSLNINSSNGKVGSNVSSGAGNGLKNSNNLSHSANHSVKTVDDPQKSLNVSGNKEVEFTPITRERRSTDIESDGQVFHNRASNASKSTVEPKKKLYIYNATSSPSTAPLNGPSSKTKSMAPLLTHAAPVSKGSRSNMVSRNPKGTLTPSPALEKKAVSSSVPKKSLEKDRGVRSSYSQVHQPAVRGSITPQGKRETSTLSTQRRTKAEEAPARSVSVGGNRDRSHVSGIPSTPQKKTAPGGSTAVGITRSASVRTASQNKQYSIPFTPKFIGERGVTMDRGEDPENLNDTRIQLEATRRMLRTLKSQETALRWQLEREEKKFAKLKKDEVDKKILLDQQKNVSELRKYQQEQNNLRRKKELGENKEFQEFKRLVKKMEKENEISHNSESLRNGSQFSQWQEELRTEYLREKREQYQKHKLFFDEEKELKEAEKTLQRLIEQEETMWRKKMDMQFAANRALQETRLLESQVKLLQAAKLKPLKSPY